MSIVISEPVMSARAVTLLLCGLLSLTVSSNWVAAAQPLQEDEKRTNVDVPRAANWLSARPAMLNADNELGYLLQFLEKRAADSADEEGTQRDIRSPLGTMRFGKRGGESPLGTMRFGKRSPLGTMRFGKRADSPLGTMRFGKRTPLIPLYN